MSARVDNPWPFPRRWWALPACWVLGCDWQTLRGHRRRRLVLVEFHRLAGLDAQCQRCGETWEDASDGCDGILSTGFSCQKEPEHEGPCDGA